MCSVVFHSHNSGVKPFYISALLPMKLNESELRDLAQNNAAWLSSHDQDHCSSDYGKLVPL